MSADVTEKHEHLHYDEKPATKNDLEMLRLQLESKILNLKFDLESNISSVTTTLGALIISCCAMLFALLSYFHK